MFIDDCSTGLVLGEETQAICLEKNHGACCPPFPIPTRREAAYGGIYAGTAARYTISSTPSVIPLNSPLPMQSMSFTPSALLIEEGGIYLVSYKVSFEYDFTLLNADGSYTPNVEVLPTEDSYYIGVQANGGLLPQTITSTSEFFTEIPFTGMTLAHLPENSTLNLVAWARCCEDSYVVKAGAQLIAIKIDDE